MIGTTSNMWNHLRLHHPTLIEGMDAAPAPSSAARGSKKTQPTITQMFAASQPYSKSSNKHKEITRVITTCLAEDGMPASAVERSGMKKLIGYFDKRYSMPSRHHFSRIAIPQLYNECREKILKELKSVLHFSATTDGWSSNFVYDPYLSLTVQYVSKDWSMTSLMLETYPLEEDHTGENLAAAIDESLDRWNLSKDKMAGITTDSAANMKRACKIMDVTRLPCFGHILHNAIQNSSTDDKIARAIASCKKVSSAFHTSYKKKRLLAEKQKAHDLPVLAVPGECKTRWMSKYKLICFVLQHESAIRDVLNDRANVHLIPSVQSFQVSQLLRFVFVLIFIAATSRY